MSELKQEDIDAMHQHQYTIPVEWEGDRNGKYMSVITLACPCGAEKERKVNQ